MKILLFVLMGVSALKSSYAQESIKKPIAILDIEKGITDFDFFRAVLIENGLKYKEKNKESEFWEAPILKQPYFCEICIQISSWAFEGKEVSRTIYFQIRKDLLPEYNKQFLASIVISFPEKKACPVITTRNNGSTSSTSEDYQLIYYRKTDKLIVEFEQEDNWAKYKFELKSGKP